MNQTVTSEKKKKTGKINQETGQNRERRGEGPLTPHS